MKNGKVIWFVCIILIALGVVFVMWNTRYARPASPTPSSQKPPSTGTQPKPVMEKPADPNHLYGFIKSVQVADGVTTIVLDEAEFIANDRSGSATASSSIAADMAMYEDGKCDLELAKTGSCTGSGFYIRNNDASTKTFTIPSTAKIELISYANDGGVGPLKTVSANTFVDIFSNPTKYQDKYYAPVQDPYTIDLVNDIVTKITSQYLP